MILHHSFMMPGWISHSLHLYMAKFSEGCGCRAQKFQDDTADVGGAVASGRLGSILYTVLTATFFAAGASYLYAPEATLQVRQLPAPGIKAWSVVLAAHAGHEPYCLVDLDASSNTNFNTFSQLLLDATAASSSCMHPYLHTAVLHASHMLQAELCANFVSRLGCLLVLVTLLYACRPFSTTSRVMSASFSGVLLEQLSCL